MIVLRRTAAVLLGLLLFAVLLGTLMLQSANDTFLKAEFYPQQLEEADVYRFVMSEVLPSALDELRERDPDEAGIELRENPIATSGLETSRITESAQRALPPEELEELVAPSVLAVAAYATGESDELIVVPPLADTIRDLVAELKVLMREAGVYERLIEEELKPRIREDAGEALTVGGDAPGWMQRLFGSDEEAGSTLARVVTSVVTPEWFATQVEHVLDELTAYLVGDSDGFEIRLRLGDEQVAAAVDELKAILHEVDAADLVYTDILDPEVDASLGETVPLPYGVEVSREEIKAVLRDAVSAAWAQEQADRLIEDVSAYVAGREDGLSTSIALGGSKEAAAILLAELAVSRVAESLDRLPACSSDGEARAVAALGDAMLPDCLPPAVTPEAILSEARTVIAAAIPERVLGSVPDTVTYSDADLRLELSEGGGPDALDALDDSRELIAEGWSYSDADLRADLASEPDVLDALDRLRDFVANGYVHTPEDPEAGVIAEGLDEAHDQAESFRRSSMVAWLIVALLLVAIGALGGTDWPGRLRWASASLLGSSLVVLFMFWPVYESMSGLFEQAREEISSQTNEDFGPTARLVGNKLVDIAEAAADDFAGGVRDDVRIVAVVSLIVLLVAVFWRRFVRPDRTLQEQALEER